MRVHELAKKLGISSKSLQEKLKKMGVEAKSHMSALNQETVSRILQPAKPEPKPVPKPGPEKKNHPTAAPPKPEKPKAPPAPEPKPALPPKTIFLKSMTVGDLAKKLQINAAELIKKLIRMNVMATINQYISEDTVKAVSKEYGFTVIKAEEEKKEVRVAKSVGGLVPRPPVVTVMGHVDHGKTTLLDAIRETRVAEKEIGAITQHIGACKIKLAKGEVVFLDTPGHEAFTAMRTRGASVTDVIVLVVAADDGIMPQTVEAIDHAKAARVPIVVAINKIDRPNARPERVKQELMKYGLSPEEFGGKTICAEVSATKKTGIDSLLEMLLLEAELLELKANPNQPAKGTIIEAKMDKRRGSVATVLVQDGTLKTGDIFIAGLSSGKVRAMTNEHGENLTSAPPSSPVEILGFPKVPYAGDSFEVVSNEAAAQEIILERRKKFETKPRPVTLGNLFERIQTGIKELKLILKADVRGSVDALNSALEKLSDAKVNIRIMHRATGDINESDVILASASQAIIIGFNVGVEASAKEIAEKEGVDIRFYQIIYNALNDIKNAMSGLLEAVYKDVFTGRAEVRTVFTLPNGRKIAGSYVLKGRIPRGVKANIVRGREKLFSGKITSLKRFKNDVRDVQEGYECGIGIEGFNDYRENDLIEVFTPQEVGAH
jgi:translation initiation factor IF-2